MSNLTTSYLPPGLTEEELAMAMAAGQSSPMLPTSSAPPAEQPVPPPVGAGPPLPVEAEAPSALEVDPVVRERGAPRQNIEAYTDQLIDTQNDRMSNIPALGDEQGLRREDHEKMAEIHEGSAKKNAGITADARRDVEESQARQKVWRQRADQIYAEMEANKQPPPDSVLSKVLAALGTVIAVGGNKPSAAQGVAMIAGTIGQDRARWEQERAANSHLYQLAVKSAESEGASDLDRLDAAQKIIALEGQEKIDALEATKQMGLGEHSDALATDMQLGVREKTLQGVMQIEEKKQAALDAKAAAAAKAGASRAKQAKRDRYFATDLSDLLAMRGTPEWNETAEEVLSERIATEQKERSNKAGADKTETEVILARKKAEDEAKAGPKMTEGERKIDTVVQGAAPAYERLSKVPDGNFNRGATKEAWVPDVMRSQETLQQRADIKNLGLAVLRAESGASFNETEIEEKFNALPVNSGDPDVRAQGLKDLLNAYHALDSQGRLKGIDERRAAETAKKQIRFTKKQGPNGEAGDVARAYLESRSGKGAGGV
jgi:hypothetical protein